VTCCCSCFKLLVLTVNYSSAGLIVYFRLWRLIEEAQLLHPGPGDPCLNSRAAMSCVFRSNHRLLLLCSHICYVTSELMNYLQSGSDLASKRSVQTQRSLQGSVS
jgi:hypothetical protein